MVQSLTAPTPHPIRKIGDPPVFIFVFKVTPSQEEHETIFSSLKINAMALSDQIDPLAFFVSVR
jgi:hypothetical protein